MNLELSQQAIQILLIIPAALISLTIHEWGHAYSAYKLGDHTAKMQGRITFNPIAHMSLIGTVIVPIVSYLLFKFPFGWAKPVPVDSRNLAKPRRDMMVIAAAGPATNIILAIFCTFIFSLMPKEFGIGSPNMYGAGKLMLMISIQLNLYLAFFNLVPVHPLDGSRILPYFLPKNLADKYNSMAQYGQTIIMILLFTGGFSMVSAPVEWVFRWLFKAFSIA